MKTLADALTIRRRVFGAFEMAQTATDPAERRRWLTFALVGAGPTGVELAGQIHELATLTLRDQFRHIDPDEARVLLFDGGTMPLAPFGPKLSARAAKALTGMGVELHMGSIVTSIDAQGLDAKGADGTVVAPRGRDRALDGRGRGAAARRAARQADRRGAGPGRPHRGAARPHDPRAPGDLGGRRPDEPRAPAGRRRGRDADRVLRGPPDQARGRAARPGRRSRSATTTSARPRTSPEGAPSSRSGASTPAASSAGWPGSGIHIAFLTTFRNRISRRPDLGHRVQPGVTPGARVHDDADRPRPGRLPAAAGAATDARGSRP